jgi:hypothetical protein
MAASSRQLDRPTWAVIAPQRALPRVSDPNITVT